MRRRKGTNFSYYLIVLYTSLAVFIIDFLTKLFAKINLTVGQVKTIIPKVLEFVYVENTGVAFGLFKDVQWLMIILSVLIICVIIYLIKDVRDKRLLISAGLILGGAIGNLFDRIMNGAIVDFIKISIWPVFNIADSAITVGAILLVIYFMKKDDNKES